ncbi:hypothetical protein Tco_1337651 [Tanacetum coccineum]
MSAKDSIAIQTCELSEEEFNEFLALYPIPSSYHVILPKSNQTVLDAPLGYVGLYTHSFSIANLRLHVTKFFCEKWILGTLSMLRMKRICPFCPSKLLQPSPAEAMADSGGSPKHELFVRKLAPGSSTVCATRAKTSASKDDVSFLTISDEDEGLSDVPELKDVTSLRSRELLEVIEKLRGECDVIKERERAREEESEGLRAKCEAAMSYFEKTQPDCLKDDISMSTELKNTKPILIDELEPEKWQLPRYLCSSWKSQVVSLEAEKARDDLGSLVGKLVTSAIVYGRCKAFEQVAAMKEPFDLTKLKGYRSSYKKEHNQAGNDLATANFPWLSEFVADPSAPVEVLLSKKPSSIQGPAPSNTQLLLPLSKKATSSFVRPSKTDVPYC